MPGKKPGSFSLIAVAHAWFLSKICFNVFNVLETPCCLLIRLSQLRDVSQCKAINTPTQNRRHATMVPALETDGNFQQKSELTSSGKLIAAVCGVMKTFGSCHNGLSRSKGSFSNTSSTAPPMTPSRKAQTRSVSLTLLPRPTLISTADGFISLSTSALMKCLVCAGCRKREHHVIRVLPENRQGHLPYRPHQPHHRLYRYG